MQFVQRLPRLSLGPLSFPWLGRCRAVRSIYKVPTLHRLRLDPREVPGNWGEGVFPPLFLVELASGRATHQGGCITSDSYLLAEMNYILSQESRGIPIDQHRHMTALRFFRRHHFLAGSVISLASVGSYNYYHWMIEILPRLHLFRTYASSLEDARYYVETHKPFQRETLQLLGFQPWQLINSREKQNIQAERLWATSLPAVSGHPHPWAVAWLRRHFLTGAIVEQSNRPISCLIISRRLAKTRAILNEEALVEKLRHLAPQVVCLEKLTVSEQISLFSRARLIIAPHGAGLTNLAFASPSSALIEIFSSHYRNDCFQNLAALVGCRYFPLFDQTERQENIVVDLITLLEVIEKTT